MTEKVCRTIIAALLFAAALSFAPSSVRAEAILFTNATIVDGSGAPAFKGDLLVGEGRIAKVGQVGERPPNTRVVDAEGMVLSPGFIDMHSHLDFQLPSQPRAENVIMQGVTTVVGGQCGFALAPQPEGSSMLAGYLAALGLGDTRLVYATLADYFEDLESKGIAVNLAMLAPHGIIRETAMGHKEGAPTEAELARMKEVLRGAMEDGAFGMSTGLAYPPGYSSDTGELIELMKTARPYGGIYFSHIRDEAGGVLDSIEEAIEVGEKAGTPVQISHVKAIGFPNYGKVADVIALMEAANERGVEVNGDVYPYSASSTSLSAIILPPSVFESGDVDTVMKSLKDPKARADTKAFAENRMLTMVPRKGALKLIPESIFLGALKYALSTTNVVVGVHGHPEYNGKTFKEIKKMRGATGDVLDLGLDVLTETEHDITIISFMMDEEDVETALKSDLVMIGSDGMGVVESGQHPRSFGTFPRVLGKCVREDKLLTLPEAIHKMTGMTAAKLGLKDRGLIKEGYHADLVLFDPDTIEDRATFEKNHLEPRGIGMVLVNGVPAYEGGIHTDARTGVILRKNQQ